MRELSYESCENRIGIYVRESRDDNEENYETIETQIGLLEDYVEKNHLGHIAKVYIDDNVSGAAFERKGLNELKEDILEGKIDIVILKDLSRLGRNNAKTLLFLDFLEENGIRVNYLHSDIDTIERTKILKELRMGEFDVLVGINLLREGLDLPEVKLVAILDADKEGFLRSETSLIQTIGRAARNSEGKVIMYADIITNSMKKAIEETKRRRQIQSEYNLKHGITPKTIVKDIVNTLEITKKVDKTKDIKKNDIPLEIEKLKALLKISANNLDFEKCIEIRDTIAKLKQKMRK